MMSTTDGKIYHMVNCFCGKQDSSGRCEHVTNPVYVEQVSNISPFGRAMYRKIDSWRRDILGLDYE